MQIPFLDLKSQYEAIKEDIDEAIAKVIKEAAFVGGEYVKRFEEEFAGFCQAKYCVGVGNGTDALFIALKALGVGKGDEVITAANSFIATSEAITMTGARVVFVDCDPQTYNIDVKKIPIAITPQTKAIIPVHLHGQPADMVTLLRIAKEYDLFLVEDAAQAHAAEINGQRVGSLGQVACFSFYPGKNLGAYGDGGAIVTNDEELAIRCRMIANHGRVKKYDHNFEGVNSRLDGLQAAILSVKLKHLEDWTKKRRDLADIYKKFLHDSEVIIPVEAVGVKHVYHLYVARVLRRDTIQAALKGKGINTGIHYPIALPNLKAYEYLGYKPKDFPIATQCSKEILSLPIYPELSRAQIQYICKHLLNEIKS
jgi:dTDP-4-amino-4,6-dideoxygalactose transaminase